MKRKILAFAMALVMAAACAVPALAATSTSKYASNQWEEMYHDFIETPSQYLTVDYATLLKDAQSGDLKTLAKDFNVNVVPVTTPTKAMAASKPGKPQKLTDEQRQSNRYIPDLSKMNYTGINNSEDVGLKPILISYENDGSLRAWVIVLNKTNHNIAVKGIDDVQLLDDQGNVFAGGQNIQFNKPLTVEGNETPWFVILEFQPGTYNPNVDLKGMKSPSIQYHLKY